MKKIIKFDAANTADSFNEVTQHTVGDGLVSIPSIIITDQYVIISSFTFIHKGIICIVSDLRTLTKPNYTDYYIYVDSNTANESADVKFYFLTQETDEYVLVAKIQNSNEIIYPELTSLPSIKEIIKYQITNNLIGNISFDGSTKTIYYKNLIHTHGIDTTFLNEGSITLPSITVNTGELGSILITPTGEILPWGSDAPAENEYNILTDYGNWFDLVPIPSKNTNIAVYSDAAGSTVIFKTIEPTGTSWAVNASYTHNFGTGNSYQASYPTKTKKIRNTALSKDTLTVGVLADSGAVNRLFLLTTNYDSAGPSFNVSQTIVSNFVVPTPLALDFDTHETTPDVVFIALLDPTNKKLYVLRIDQYSTSIGAQISTDLNTAIDFSASNVAIRTFRDRVYVVVYGTTHDSIEYEYDYNLTTTYNSAVTVAPATSLYNFEFVGSSKVTAFTYDDGTNVHLIYNDTYSSKDIVLGASTSVSRVFTSFTKNYMLLSWQDSSGNVYSKLVSRNFEKDLSSFTTTYYLTTVSQLHNGFEGIVTVSAQNLNIKPLADRYIVVPDDTSTLAIAVYDDSGNVELVTSKRGSIYSQATETKGTRKFPILDIDTIYSDWISSSGRSVPEIHLSGTIRIKTAALPPVVLKGGKIIVDSGVLGGGGTILNFTYDSVTKKITLTSANETIKDYGIAPGTIITSPVNAKVVEIDKVDYKWFIVDTDLGTPTSIEYVNKIVIEECEIDASTASLELRNVVLRKCRIDNASLTLELINDVTIKDGCNVTPVLTITAGASASLDLINNYADWSISNDGTLSLNYVNEKTVTVSGTGILTNKGKIYADSIEVNQVKTDTLDATQSATTTLITNLNADLLDGAHADFEPSASTVTLRDTVGNLKTYTRLYFREETGDTGLSYIQKEPAANLYTFYMNGSPVKVGNADKLDGYHAGHSTNDIPIIGGFDYLYAYRSTNQTLTAGTWNTIAIDTKDSNASKNITFSASTNEAIIPEDGWYLIHGQVAWNGSLSQPSSAQVAVDAGGVTFHGFIKDIFLSSYGRVSLIVYLNTNDSVFLKVYVDSAETTLQITGGSTNTFLQIVRLV